VIIESSAPTRVDLAGSTIDIPPLFLFHEGAATVNFAVNLLAKCRIETRADELIILESLDRKLKVESSLEKIEELRTD
jgi:D-glycero-alpha-D-manno-heptose-7-phosphate kinase